MRRRQLLKGFAGALGLALLGESARAAARRSFTSIPKSLWVWRTPLAESGTVLDLARKYNFRTVFYSIPPADRPALFEGRSREVNAVHAFRQAGMEFNAVSGDPSWCRREGGLPRPVEELLDFQLRSGILTGLCLDVEPHVLPEWKTGEREAVVAGYLDLLCRIGKASRNVDITLTAAVVPYYANIPSPRGAGQSVLETVADRVHETVMMAYRNSPREALRVAEKSLEQLNGAYRPWWFGVSTHQQAEPGVSYGDSTFMRLRADLVDMDDRLDERDSFYRGIAINDYPSLTSLLRR